MLANCLSLLSSLLSSPRSTTARAGSPPTSIRWACEHRMPTTPTARCCAAGPTGPHHNDAADSVNRLTVQVDSLGNRTSFTWDTNGRLTSTTNPIGAIATRLYDQQQAGRHDRPARITNKLWLRVSSNLIRTTNPLGQINTSVFDLAKRLVAQVDPLGNRTSYAYDAAWNVIRTRTRSARSRPACLTRQPLSGDDRLVGESDQFQLRRRERSDPDDQPAWLDLDQRV